MKKSAAALLSFLLLSTAACTNPATGDNNGNTGGNNPTTVTKTSEEGCNAAPSGSLVKDGNFEETEAGSSWKTFNANQAFGPWKVDNGSIDIVNTAHLKAGQGEQTLDLDGSAPGAVSQEISTEAGKAYKLSFCLSGNAFGAPQIKEVEAFWGENSLGTFTYDATGKTNSTITWTTHNVSIPASMTTGNTTLKFVSKTPAAGTTGPALDVIAVTAL